MEKKVESRDQSGGITAEKVNIVHNYNTGVKEAPKNKKNKTLKTVIVLITLAASIVAILSYFNIYPKHNLPYVNDKSHQVQPR